MNSAEESPELQAPGSCDALA